MRTRRTMQSFVMRHSLLRAWGEFQETHSLIVAPIYTDVPFEAGIDLDDGRVAETIRGIRMATAVNALGLPAVVRSPGLLGCYRLMKIDEASDGGAAPSLREKSAGRRQS